MHAPPDPILTPPDDPYRVLLVEDDPEYGRMVERVLRRGRPPLWVHREERLDAALARLERSHYDALVVDLGLPDGGGIATLGCACGLANHLPVLVLTGTDDENLAIEAIRAGAEDFLIKQRTHALSLPGTVLRAIERHRRVHARPRVPVGSARRAGDLREEVLLLEHLDGALARAERHRESVAVLVASYANLDWLAEALGEPAVETLFARAEERMAPRIRRGDRLLRLDPERLVVVIEGCGERERVARVGAELAEAMRGVENEPIDGVQVVGLEARVGIAVHPADGADPETLLENAEAALGSVPHGGAGFYGRA